MEARECGCPDWVIRCSHFRGAFVGLVDRLSPFHGHHERIRQGRRYFVTEPDDCLVQVQCGECATGQHFIGVAEEPATDDLPAAEAEFFRREAELLGREVPA